MTIVVFLIIFGQIPEDMVHPAVGVTTGGQGAVEKAMFRGRRTRQGDTVAARAIAQCVATVFVKLS